MNFSFVLDLLGFLWPNVRHWITARRVASRVTESVASFDTSGELAEMVSPRHLGRTLRRWLNRRDVLRLLLPCTPQTRAYAVVYYERDCLAITCIVNRRGGRTFEYQHGIQNNQHPMYSNVYAPGQTIGDAMPRHFLAWDSVAAKRFDGWASRALGPRLGSSIIGNLWQESLKCTPIVPLDPDTVAMLSSAHAVILVALQEWPNTFNMDILAALDVVDEHGVVVVRPHPLDSTRTDVIEHTFRTSGSHAQFRFEVGNAHAVEALFPYCQLCITGYSTVGLDANEHGVPCLFTHPNAADGLRDYLERPDCHYADTAEQMRPIIAAAVAAGRRERPGSTS